MWSCSVVNDMHELLSRIAELEGRGSYLKGQPHQWEQVPPSNGPSYSPQATFTSHDVVPQV